MKEFLEYVASHQMTVMAIAFVSLLAIYFIFKQLFKLALIIILVALSVGGYYYFKDPEKMSENIRQKIQDTREKSGKLVESGKKAYEKGKNVYKKGKELTKEARDYLKKKERNKEKEEEKKQDDTPAQSDSQP